MDTRSKILNAADARRIPGPVALATGYFDVLRAEHIAELEALVSSRSESPTRLVVAVLQAEGALLDQRARTELVAGLRMVDYVIAASGNEVEELIQTLRPQAIARLETEHARLARDLKERAIRRSGNPAATR